jgi:hypothetical protein
MFVSACSGSPTGPSVEPPTPLNLSLDSSGWQTIGEPNPFPLATNSSAHLEFDFPSSGSMHYLYTPSPLARLRGTVVVSLRVVTTGPVVFNSLDPITNSCSIPASVRPFLWANQNGSGAFDRWWSNPRAFALADGNATITVPLSPESWSSVNGQFGNADSATRFAFDKALLNVSRLGLTFGGGCSFGHGINVRGGSAAFQLTSYTVQ